MGDKSEPKILGYVLVYRERDVLTRTGRCRAKPGPWCYWRMTGWPIVGKPDSHGLFLTQEDAEFKLAKMDRDAREYWRKTKTSFACRQAKHVAVEGFVVPVEAPR